MTTLVVTLMVVEPAPFTEVGSKVATAPDGYQALQTIRSRPPDIAVLDLRMPKLDGFSVCQKLRADQKVGRTPVINKDAGRDHWPNVSCALLACGGMKTGQVIGSTDRLGGEANDRPVHFQGVFATLYHNMGIDVNKVTVTDLAGRPHYLVDGHQPMKELI